MTNKENRKSKLNRASKVALLSGLVLMGSLGGFAWLSTSDVATENQVINAGTFDIAFANEQNAILDEAAFPVSDDVGKASQAYTFDITNTGSIDALVRLSVEANKGSDTDNMLPADKVNVEIKTTDGTVIYDGTLADIEATTATYGAGEVMRIDGSGTKNLEMRAWIDESAVNTDLYGADETETRDVEMKVKLTAVQADGGLFTHGSDGSSEDEMNTWETQWDAALAKASE